MLEAPHALLACFGSFYEQVAAIKLAACKGQLEALLAEPGVAPPASGGELAARVHARLLGFLEHQQRGVAAASTGSQMQAYRVTLKVMAAVADEALLFDLDWSGRDCWLGMLLEARLFRTRDAGSFFFELAERLVRSGGRTVLERDVASVLLFALQLGFRGRLRGAEAAGELQAWRTRLSRLAHEGDTAGHAFPQAYGWTRRDGAGERNSTLGPWLRAGAAVFATCLLLSAVAWFWTAGPLLDRLAAPV